MAKRAPLYRTASRMRGELCGRKAAMLFKGERGIAALLFYAVSKFFNSHTLFVIPASIAGVLRKVLWIRQKL